MSAPIDSHDATTKKFVTDLLKTKSDKIYVDNELAKKASQSNVNKALAALKDKVKKLEATVGKLQKQCFCWSAGRNAFLNKFNAPATKSDISETGESPADMSHRFSDQSGE